MKRILLPALLAVLAGCGTWTTPETPDSIEEAYYLRVGDTLAVEVADHPEFSGYVVVRKDGTIGMPLLEKSVGAVIHVRGGTTEEMADAVRDLISPYVIDSPEVAVTLSDHVEITFEVPISKWPTTWHMTWEAFSEIGHRTEDLTEADHAFDVWAANPPPVENP